LSEASGAAIHIVDEDSSCRSADPEDKFLGVAICLKM